MNDDINRNTRTLIVSFVVAVMVLIPLRFVEVGNSVSSSSGSAVLGDSVAVSGARFEAPYDQIEMSKTCVSGPEADTMIDGLVAKLNDSMGTMEVKQIVDEMASIEAARCVEPTSE